MQVVHTNHSFTRPASRKAPRFISRLAQAVVVALAIVGALHLVEMSPLASSTAATAGAIDPITPASFAIIPASFDYFPDQFVNQGTQLEEPIPQF
ncbi:MAG: hypothetical protein ACR2FI_06385 [Burkholderiales bacterium]|nr:hypothetical protein [Pseudomonadota bacterium]